MKKVTLTMNLDDIANIEGLFTYIKGTELYKNTCPSLSVEDDDNIKTTRTEWMVFPTGDSDIDEVKWYSNGSIITYTDVDTERLRKLSRWHAARNIYDIVGEGNLKMNDLYYVINMDAVNSLHNLKSYVMFTRGYRLYTIDGEENTGVIKLLDVDEVFNLYKVGNLYKMSDILRIMSDINYYRRNNKVDTSNINKRVADMYYETISKCTQELETNLEQSITQSCTLLHNNEVEANVLYELIVRLMRLSKDKKRLFYNVVKAIKVDSSGYSINTYPCVKIALFHMMKELNFITDLELNLASSLFNESFGIDDDSIIKRCQYAILQVYYSFMVRDKKLFKQPKYATEHLEFSLQTTQNAARVVDKTCTGFKTKFMNINTNKGEKYCDNIISERYELDIKPLIVNLAKAVSKDKMIFKTYTEHVIDTLYVLNYYIGDKRVVRDFTNAITPMVNELTPKLVETTVIAFFKTFKRYGSSQDLFSDCSDYKKVKSAVMLGKLAK